jgi:two-component system, OmpR family, alkaline phosphatase synthesis response regulator PhoP
VNSKLIFAVDDEPDILELIRFNIQREGYQFLGADTGESALTHIKKLCAADAPAAQRPELIILDLMLPGIDGLTICRRLKSAPETRNIPIIMLTAKAEDSDVVTGLEVGADDYIAKPFSPKVLIARIRSLLRARSDLLEQTTHQETVPSLITVGQMQIDIARHEVRCAQILVDLSATEFAILEFLARNPGWVFPRNRIIDGVKGKDYPVTERSVDVQILGLRKKLGSFGDYIQTVRGVGYRLQAP